MYEYELMNKETKERTFIWGYNYNDAFRRNPDLTKTDWVCIHTDYVD